MMKEIYSIGGFYFYSAKEVAEFKTQETEYWEQVKHLPLKKRGIMIDSCQDFLDYLNSLNHCPDICIEYSADDYMEEFYHTTVLCDNLEVRGIFACQSLNLEEHWVFEIISQSKWSGMKIIQKFL